MMIYGTNHIRRWYDWKEIIKLGKFNVSIIETVGFTVDIEAINKNEAEKIVMEKYKNNTLEKHTQRELLEIECIAD